MRANLLCRTAIPKRIAVSQFQKIKQNEFLCIVYNFGDIRSPNPRVNAVNNNTFCDDMAKIGIIMPNNLGISRTYLDLLYRFGSRIGGDDYPDIQLNLGDVRRRLQECLLLFALAFNNQFADREAAFNNPATSCTSLVNFRPIILEFIRC